MRAARDSPALIITIKPDEFCSFKKRQCEASRGSPSRLKPLKPLLTGDGDRDPLVDDDYVFATRSLTLPHDTRTTYLTSHLCFATVIAAGRVAELGVPCCSAHAYGSEEKSRGFHTISAVKTCSDERNSGFSHHLSCENMVRRKISGSGSADRLPSSATRDC